MKANINIRELQIKIWNAYAIDKAITKHEALMLIELISK